MIRRRLRRPARPRPDEPKVTSVSLSGCSVRRKLLAVDRALAGRRSRRRSPRSRDGRRRSPRRRRGPRAAARCRRAWPAGCRRTRRVPAASTGPAGGHRVGARAQRRGHDQPVAGHAHVELVVDGDVGDELAGAAADHDEVVGGPVVGRVRRGDRQRRQRPRGPVARPDALERRPRAARPSPRSARRGCRRRRRGPARRFGAAARSAASTVPSPPTATTRSPSCERARRGHLAMAVAVDRELHHVDAVLGGPAP